MSEKSKKGGNAITSQFIFNREAWLRRNANKERKDGDEPI